MNVAVRRAESGFEFNGWCLGLFLIVSCSTVVSLRLTSALPDLANLGWVSLGWVSIAERGLTFVCLALSARHLITLIDRPRVLMAAALTMTVGILGTSVSFLWLDGYSLWVVALLSSVLFNIGYAVLYLGWMELYSHMDFVHVLVYFTLTHFLSALMSFFVVLVDSSIIVAVVAASTPLFCLLALRKADKQTREASYRQGEQQKTGWTISVRPLVLLAAFSFSNAIIRGFLGTEDRTVVLSGVCVAAVGVLAVVLLRFGRFEVRSLYQVSVPVLVLGALFVLMSFEWSGVAAAFCSNAAFTLFSIFVTTVFCSISYRYGVNAVWMLGITQFSLSLGSFAGRVSSQMGEVFFTDPSVLVVAISALVVLLVVLSMVLVSDRDFKTTWGISSRNDDQGSLTVLDEEELTLQACSRVAQRFGLTRREEEVLVLMMRGYTLARIGEELYVAESTMKTHSRHIYRKVGVGNRNELQEYVAAYRR